jgi:hypothetical protein
MADGGCLRALCPSGARFCNRGTTPILFSKQVFDLRVPEASACTPHVLIGLGAHRPRISILARRSELALTNNTTVAHKQLGPSPRRG